MTRKEIEARIKEIEEELAKPYDHDADLARQYLKNEDLINEKYRLGVQLINRGTFLAVARVWSIAVIAAALLLTVALM